jgi:hypothetical protein
MPGNAEDNALAPLIRWSRVVLVLGLALWTVQFARTPLSADANESFLHLPDLIFHEAGHIIFSPFGRFMTVLGGSLLQVLIPIIAAVSFVRQEEPFGTAVCAWWAGQNFVDLAPYIADARALRMILLGGRTGAEVEGHDWEFILTQLGLTHLDRQIGMTAYGLGLLIMIGALAFAVRTILRNETA